MVKWRIKKKLVEKTFMNTKSVAWPNFFMSKKGNNFLQVKLNLEKLIN